METILSNTRRIIPVLALVSVTTLVLSGCVASSTTLENNGVRVTAVKVGEIEINESFMEAYPTEGKACVFDVTIENISDDFVVITHSQFSSDTQAVVNIGLPDDYTGKASFLDAIGDQKDTGRIGLQRGLYAGETVEYAASVACVSTDTVFKLSGRNGSLLIKVPIEL
jgi:hypothetical protein